MKKKLLDYAKFLSDKASKTPAAHDKSVATAKVNADTLNQKAKEIREFVKNHLDPLTDDVDASAFPFDQLQTLLKALEAPNKCCNDMIQQLDNLANARERARK